MSWYSRSWTTPRPASQLYHDGLMEAASVEQTSVFEVAEH